MKNVLTAVAFSSLFALSSAQAAFVHYEGDEETTSICTNDVKYEDTDLTAMEIDAPEDTIQYRPITLHNGSHAYTIDNATLTTTCIDTDLLEERRAAYEDHLANEPDKNDSVAWFEWFHEKTTLAFFKNRTRKVEESTTRRGDLNSAGAKLGIFHTIDSAEGWSCNSKIKIDVLWGETQSFDLERDTNYVKAKGTSQNVRIEEHHKGHCDFQLED